MKLLCKIFGHKKQGLGGQLISAKKVKGKWIAFCLRCGEKLD